MERISLKKNQASSFQNLQFKCELLHTYLSRYDSPNFTHLSEINKLFNFLNLKVDCDKDNLVILIIIKLMLFIFILSTDILESEEFNPPVDSFDQLTQLSTIPSIEETNAESANGSTVYEPPIQLTIDESTIEGPTPHSVERADETLTFQIMDGASERGKRKLIDSCGFSYNIKRQRLDATDWQCTVRPTVRFLFSSQ